MRATTPALALLGIFCLTPVMARTLPAADAIRQPSVQLVEEHECGPRCRDERAERAREWEHRRWAEEHRREERREERLPPPGYDRR